MSSPYPVELLRLIEVSTRENIVNHLCENVELFSHVCSFQDYYSQLIAEVHSALAMREIDKILRLEK